MCLFVYAIKNLKKKLAQSQLVATVAVKHGGHLGF